MRTLHFVMPGTLMRKALPVAAVFMIVCGTSVPASAQITRERVEAQRLNNMLNRMEQQIEDLERYVYGEDGVPPAETQGPAAPGAGNANLPATALLSERVDNLDLAVRNLTGEVERLNFQLSQLDQRLNRALGDFDLRLQALEGNGGAALGSGSPYASTYEEDTGTGPAVSAAPAYGGTGDVDVGFAAPTSGPGAPQTLGSIPASALAGDEDADFEIGMQLLRQGDFNGAQSTFEGFIQNYPSSDRLGEANFWLGESLYVRGRYADAANAYLVSARDFGDGEKAPDSLLKLGMSLAALGQVQEACSAFDQVARSYPNASDRVTRNVARERAANSCN